jgi:hypothetical protein
MEVTSSNTTPTNEKKGSFFSMKIFGGLLNAQWLTGNLNFVLFLSFLAIIYIANGHMSDKTIRNINKTKQELKQLQFEYKTLKSEVMFRSEEAQVLQASAPLGLKVSSEIPQRLQLQVLPNSKGE